MRKDIDTSRLRRSLTSYIIIAIFIVLVITAFIISVILSDEQEHRKATHDRYIHKSIKHAIKEHVSDYSDRIQSIINSDNVADLLKKGDREGLYKLLVPKWNLMKRRQNHLNVLNIHLKDGTLFFRLENPDKFGDSVLNKRPMIRQIHLYKKAVSGYEICGLTNSYRIIYPIFDKKNIYLGAIELGIDPIFILKAVEDINGFTGMMFMNEASVKEVSKFNKLTIDGYRLQSDLSPELEKISTKLKLVNRLENDIKISTDNKTYLTNLYVLYGFMQHSKVKIVFFEDITESGFVTNYLLYLLFIPMILIFILLPLLVYGRLSVLKNKISSFYKEQLHKLNDSEKRFRLLFEKAPYAYQSLDINGNILRVNAQWCKELGYAKEEVIGKNFGDFLTAEYKQKYIEKFTQFKNDKSVSNVEFEMVCKEGEHILIILNGNTIYDKTGKLLHTQCSFVNITKQKELEKELAFNQSYLQSVFDVTPNIMITTDGEKIDMVNPAMLDFFGFDNLDDFKNEHDCICDYFLPGKGLIQAEMDGINWLEYLLDKDTNLNKVYMMKGTEIHIFVVFAKWINIDKKLSFLVTFTDVTELEVLNTRLKYALDGIDDGIWDWDIDKDEIYFSPRWESMLGFKENEISNIDGDWFDLMHPDDLEDTHKKLHLSREKYGVPYHNIYRMRHKDGHWVWILSRAQTIFDGIGKATRMVGFHTDISKIKALEEELHKKEEIMISQSRHAAMGEMISMIAHQWRQPISVIAMGANNILVDIELELLDNETLGKTAKDIIDQTQELSDTIDDFRNFFRPVHDTEDVLPEDILKEAFMVIGKSLENNTIEVIQEIHSNKSIKTYSRELMQVLINILKNAKEVLVEKVDIGRKMIISIVDEDDYIVITICDNGGGIKEDILPNIFDPYFTTKGVAEGTGLGLYMSKTIIEEHLYGRLQAYNKDNGACFKIRLPFHSKLDEQV